MLAECKTHATEYMAAPFTQTGQNGAMMYHFLYDSLAPEGLIKENIDPTVCNINGEFDVICFLLTRQVIATITWWLMQWQLLSILHRYNRRTSINVDTGENE
jgi:hypothetical protein